MSGFNVSETMRHIEYLFDKYVKDPDTRIAPLHRDTNDIRYVPRIPLTQEEHDRLYEEYPKSGMYLRKFAHAHGRSAAVVFDVVKQKHKLWATSRHNPKNR